MSAYGCNSKSWYQMSNRSTAIPSHYPNCWPNLAKVRSLTDRWGEPGPKKMHSVKGCRVPVGCRYILVTITMEPLVVRKLMLPSVMTMFLPCNGALRTGHVASGDELAAAKAKPFWLGYTSHQGQAVFASALSPCVFGKVPLKKLVDSAYVAANK